MWTRMLNNTVYTIFYRFHPIYYIHRSLVLFRTIYPSDLFNFCRACYVALSLEAPIQRLLLAVHFASDAYYDLTAESFDKASYRSYIHQFP